MNRIMTTIAAASLAAGLGAGTAVAAPTAQSETTASPAAAGQMAGVRAVLQDARLAGMKAALKLTPDQEKNWTPFEAAVRDSYTQRNRIMGTTREAIAKDDPVQLLNTLSDDASQGAAQMKKVADAAKPLYDSLTPTQKQTFGPLLLTLRGSPMMAAERQQHIRQLLMRRWAQAESTNGD